MSVYICPTLYYYAQQFCSYITEENPMSTEISKTIAQNKLESLDKLNLLQGENDNRPKVSVDHNATITLIGGDNEMLGSPTKATATTIKLTFSDFAQNEETEVLIQGKQILQQACYDNAAVEACHEYHRNEILNTRFVAFSTEHEGFFDIDFSNGFDDEFILDTLKEITATFKQVVNSRPLCSTISLSHTEKYITIRGKESDSFVDVELEKTNFSLALKRMIQEQRRTLVSVDKRRGG